MLSLSLAPSLRTCGVEEGGAERGAAGVGEEQP